MCHAPGDPNHHEVCATITKDFWPESGQGHTGIYGKWCICVHKLADWLRGASAHHGILGVDCNATSMEALKIRTQHTSLPKNAQGQLKQYVLPLHH